MVARLLLPLPRHRRQRLTAGAESHRPQPKSAAEGVLKTVRDGFPDEGMQAWSKLLDDEQITQLCYYVMARTDKVLPAGKAGRGRTEGWALGAAAGWPKK